MPRAIIDPRLHAALEDFVPARCTAQYLNETETPGGVVPGVPSDVPGIINIQCRIGPLILIRPTDSEDRTGRITTEIKTRQLKMNGFFPQIDAATMRMKVNGQVYRTRLRLEVIRP